MYEYICILYKYINGGCGGGSGDWGGAGWCKRAYRQWVRFTSRQNELFNFGRLRAGGRTAVRVAVEHLKRRKRDNNLNSSRFQTTSKVLLQEQ